MTVVKSEEEDDEKKKKKKNEEENDDDDDAHAGVVDLHECLEMVEDFINLYRGSREEDVERIEAIANEHEELHATSRKRERHMSEVIREMTKRVQNAERKTSALLSSTTRSDRFRSGEEKRDAERHGAHGTRSENVGRYERNIEEDKKRDEKETKRNGRARHGRNTKAEKRALALRARDENRVEIRTEIED